MLKSKKTIFAIIGAILLIGGIACTLILLTPKSERPLTPQELLSLGNKYLSELDYENAVVAFTKLIEIEPRNPQGYIGLAGAYIGLGDIDRAIEILEQGLEATGDDEIRRMLENLLNPEAELTNITTIYALPPEPETQNMRERNYETMEFGGYVWRVLENQGNKALLITEDIIESRAYHGNYAMDAIKLQTTWADSDIRAYLNGEFYNSFRESDKSNIIEVVNSNPNNPWYGTVGGVDTNDYIFLLSIDEAIMYFGDSGDLENQIRWKIVDNVLQRADDGHWLSDKYNENRHSLHAGGTHIEWDGETRTVGKGTLWWWWLRTPGANSYSAVNIFHAGVVDAGSIFVVGYIVNYDGNGIRPALWLNLES